MIQSPTYQSPTVVVFSHQAEEESSIKQFVSSRSKRKNQKVAEILLSRTLDMVKETGLPSIVISTNEQLGGNFGNRLYAAFEHAFSKGAESVIVIGSDCPGLSAERLQFAAKKLAAQKTVLGPDLRGGAYLIGLQKADFSRDIFEKVRWRGSETFDDLKANLVKRSQMVATLSPLADINSAIDLELWLSKTGKITKLGKLLRDLVTFITPVFTLLSIRAFLSLSKRSFSLRGPPCPQLHSFA